MAALTPNYGGFREDTDPYYLGVAKDPTKVEKYKYTLKAIFRFLKENCTFVMKLDHGFCWDVFKGKIGATQKYPNLFYDNHNRW